jgi:hypothetical protein
MVSDTIASSCNPKQQPLIYINFHLSCFVDQTSPHRIMFTVALRITWFTVGDDCLVHEYEIATPWFEYVTELITSHQVILVLPLGTT